ncbi:lipid A biosynthesis lauroyl acyltransferase [Hoeflea prorocentri]|uniref:Lipid A biosynthesis lauroyl acyltransferase n=1 Tax=Hoeflea prorocentri TaxID=1922333 RepID=A0A9X3UID4_9HYPH|nr:lipid A biosynthesis lauroyl acyltransferase [Hoeflea prorocentri]MCY6381370.1 lipid A biosynthesis lauroyl acyltransferase [Hoeflea prorocentri]MDA5399170.1 lipid A biosynthesis lauroyl acyltransferase [Hoeflea prorocentri]
MSPFAYRFFFRLYKAKNWIVAQIVFTALRLLRLIPVQTALRFTEKAAAFIGPKTKRHRLALFNLSRAFPEKSEEEREKIAVEMWANMSRLMVEYVFVEQLIDHDLRDGEGGLIEVDGIERFLDLRDNPRPFIVFTAHTGNFELLPIIGAKYGLHVTALFRPPNNPYIAKQLMAARRTHMGQLIPSRVGASWNLASVLEQGQGVGLLVDQKFHKGAKTKFFGMDVQTNSLLVKLARNYDCEVYPARSIRLPNGKFRLEMEPAIELPRNDKGQIDINGTAQLLNDKVESWVREYPGQWQWFHDRWNMKHIILK